jgi:hypothetical protein
MCISNGYSYYRRLVMKSVNGSQLVFFGLAFVCYLSVVPAIYADIVVPVPNGDMMSTTNTTVPAAGYPDGCPVVVPTGWNVGTDYYAPSTSVQSAPSGSGNMWFYQAGNWGYGGLGAGSLLQVNIGSTVHAAGDVYTLKFDAISSQNGDFNTPVPLDLTAEILVNSVNVATGDVIFTASSPTPSYKEYSLTWTATADAVGGNLGIFFNAAPGLGTNAQTGVGNVRLSYAPAPEPSTVVLLGIGMLGLLAYAWRKRKCVPS